jgi:hypothetical protein
VGCLRASVKFADGVVRLDVCIWRILHNPECARNVELLNVELSKV